MERINFHIIEKKWQSKKSFYSSQKKRFKAKNFIA